MRNARKWAGILAGVLVLSLVAAACGGDDDDGSGDSGSTGGTGATGLSGSITVSGSSTVLPISNLVAELFSGAEPGRAGQRGRPRHRRRVRALLQGRDRHLRRIAPDRGRREGGLRRRRHRLRRARGRVRRHHGHDEPRRTTAVTCLNAGDLYALFGPESEGIDTWNGADSLADEGRRQRRASPTLRSRSRRPARSPAPTTRSSSSSGIEDIALEQGVSEDEAATLRPDYQSSPDDNVIIQAMEGSAERARVHRLRVRGGRRRPDQGASRSTGGAAASSRPAETIADGSYPLSRTLYIYVNKDEDREQPGAEGVRRPLPVRRRHRERRPAGRIRRPSDRPDRRHPLDVGFGIGLGFRESRTAVRGPGGFAARSTRRNEHERLRWRSSHRRRGSPSGASEGARSRRRKERIVHGLFAGAAVLSIVISAAIVLALLGTGDRVPHQGRPRRPLDRRAGSRARTSSTSPRSSSGRSLIAVVAMVVAIPLGLGAAIYLAEYADGRLRRILKPILETLAGIPSVVMGFFALSVISPDFVKTLFSGAGTFSLLAAGIGVGILTMPLVASVAEDAMYAVPGALREAAYGIGARRRSVTTQGRVPRRGLRDRGGRDPRDLARGRRDDGRRDRRRRDRRLRCGRSTSSARARR